MFGPSHRLRSPIVPDPPTYDDAHSCDLEIRSLTQSTIGACMAFEGRCSVSAQGLCDVNEPEQGANELSKNRHLSSLANLAKMRAMKVVNMHEAKTTLSQIVEQAERGEEIVIARAGVPVARVVAFRAGARRQLGQWSGRVRMSADFDAPLSSEDQRGWDGEE